MNQMTSDQTKIHDRAVACGRNHRGAEAALMLALQDVGRARLHRLFDCPSLFAYAVRELALTESVAGMCLAVARKAALIPELQLAVVERRMSVSLASRLVAALTPENAGELIAFALAHTSREVDEECARRNPQRDARDRAKPTGGGRVTLTVTVSREIHELIKRVQSLEARRGKGAGLERALGAATEEYLDGRDPVRKAARAQAGKPAEAPASPDPCMDWNKQKFMTLAADKRRVPLTAAQRHAVHSRDGGRCAHVGESGKRCASDRYVDLHHVRPVSKGGGNEHSNLTALCSFHHDLVHQTSFPIDGQVSWLRAAVVEY